MEHTARSLGNLEISGKLPDPMTPRCVVCLFEISCPKVNPDENTVTPDENTVTSGARYPLALAPEALQGRALWQAFSGRTDAEFETLFGFGARMIAFVKDVTAWYCTVLCWFRRDCCHPLERDGECSN